MPILPPCYIILALDLTEKDRRDDTYLILWQHSIKRVDPKNGSDFCFNGSHNDANRRTKPNITKPKLRYSVKWIRTQLTLGSIQFTKVNSSSYNIANHKSESFPAPLKKFNKIFHAIPLEPDVDKIIWTDHTI